MTGEFDNECKSESTDTTSTAGTDSKLVCETGSADDVRQSLAQERTRTAMAGEEHLPGLHLAAGADQQGKDASTVEKTKAGLVLHKDSAGRLTEVDFTDGRIARMKYDAQGKLEKCLVTGPDGKEREYVQADKQVQTPGSPTRYVFDGGAIDNQTDKPVLALGKGIGHAGNTHGDGYLRIIPANTKTDAGKNDFDGIVTDKNYQPVVMPDGKVFMPSSVGPEADWLKVPDRNTGIVTDKGAQVETPWLPPKGDGGPRKMREYTGGRPVTPETPEIRERDQKNQ